MRCLIHSISALCVLAIASCGEDPQLVEKREKQKAEITRLKGEIDLIDEKLKSLPPDVTEEYAEVKQQLEKQNAEVERLQTEVASLNARKRALQKEYDAYRIKYQVK